MDGYILLVPDTREHGSDLFPRDHDLSGEINMTCLKGAAGVDLGDNQVSGRRVLAFPAQASRIGFVNLKILDLVAGLHLKNGHWVTASSGARALEEVNNVVAFNDAAGIAVFGDVVNNIGLNADSGITNPAFLGYCIKVSGLEVSGKKYTHDGYHLQFGRQDPSFSDARDLEILAVANDDAMADTVSGYVFNCIAFNAVNAESEAIFSDLHSIGPPVFVPGRSEHGSRLNRDPNVEMTFGVGKFPKSGGYAHGSPDLFEVVNGGRYKGSHARFAVGGGKVFGGSLPLLPTPSRPLWQGFRY